MIHDINDILPTEAPDRSIYEPTPEELDNEIRVDEIVTEIKTIQRQTSQILLSSSVEIGKLLCEAKEKLPYGEWGCWLKDNFALSQRTANVLMTLFRNYGTPDQLNVFQTDDSAEIYKFLTPSQAYALLPLPEAERREYVETHDMSETSVKEIEREIAARKEAEERAKAAEDELTQARLRAKVAENDAEEAKTRLAGYEKELDDRDAAFKEQIKGYEEKLASAEIRAAHAEANAKTDEKAIKAEIKKDLEAKFAKKLENEKKELSDKLAEAEQKTAQLGADLADATNKAKVEAEAEYTERLVALEERATAAEKKLTTAGDAAVQQCAVWFENLQHDVAQLKNALDKVKDPETAGKLRAGIKNVLNGVIAAIAD